MNLRVALWRILSIGLVAWPTTAIAAAWTQEEGHGQVITTTTLSRADESFDNSRNLSSRPRYDKLDVKMLMEYGLTDRLTLILAPGFQNIEVGSSGSSESSTPLYVEGGGRYRFMKGDNWVFSGQTTIHLTGNSDTGSATPVDTTGTEIDLRALFGYSFSFAEMPAFIDLQLAHRFRSNGSPNEIHADVTFGVRPVPKWLVMAQFFNVVSEGSGDPGFSSYDYFKFQPSVVYHATEKWALQAGVFTTYTGRNSIQENGIVLGLWYDF